MFIHSHKLSLTAIQARIVRSDASGKILVEGLVVVKYVKEKLGCEYDKAWNICNRMCAHQFEVDVPKDERRKDWKIEKNKKEETGMFSLAGVKFAFTMVDKLSGQIKPFKNFDEAEALEKLFEDYHTEFKKGGTVIPDDPHGCVRLNDDGTLWTGDEMSKSQAEHDLEIARLFDVAMVTGDRNVKRRVDEMQMEFDRSQKRIAAVGEQDQLFKEREVRLAQMNTSMCELRREFEVLKPQVCDFYVL